jgi:hypothetical protein
MEVINFKSRQLDESPGNMRDYYNGDKTRRQITSVKDGK